jgi:hypothetical protein
VWLLVVGLTGVGAALDGGTYARTTWLPRKNPPLVRAVSGDCGTSVAMIEKHYGRWLNSDDQQLALLTASKFRKAGPKAGAG